MKVDMSSTANTVTYNKWKTKAE